MVKTKRNFMKVAVGLLVIIFGLSACSQLGFGDSNSLKLAKKVQKKEATLANFKTGDLRLNSSIKYYEESVSMAEEWLSQAANYDLTPEELAGIEAWKAISQVLVDKLPDTDESSTDKADAAYIGTENGSTVYGIFVYYFADDFSLASDAVEKANVVAEYTGEYYFVSGKYIVSVDQSFISGNGLSVDTVFSAIESAL